MLGSAMYIWCKRQQIRHWTSRRLQSKLSSPSSIPLFGVLVVITLWTFLSKLSGLTPFAFSSSVGKQISKRIWTAALSYKQIKQWISEVSEKFIWNKSDFVFTWTEVKIITKVLLGEKWAIYRAVGLNFFRVINPFKNLKKTTSSPYKN